MQWRSPFINLHEIVREQRAITGVDCADVALCLGEYFGMTPQFWMNLQADYELRPAATRAPQQDQTLRLYWPTFLHCDIIAKAIAESLIDETAFDDHSKNIFESHVELDLFTARKSRFEARQESLCMGQL